MMSDGTAHEQHDRDGGPQERPADQDEAERESRSGGDAEAAGSPAEREAIARDEDDTWSDTEDAGDRSATDR
jgi:hypothetical protein